MRNLLIRALRALPALTLLWSAAAFAQPAHIVDDLITSVRPAGVAAHDPVAFGPDVYFSAASLASGLAGVTDSFSC